MAYIPGWPAGTGPRILTLVGNDLTIDTRSRNTASFLAGSGFRVIAIGVDSAGSAPPVEELDGALIYRVTPGIDSRVSPRMVRVSRAEVRDWFRHRVEMQRQRLGVTRRYLTAWRQWKTQSIAPSARLIGRVWDVVGRILLVPEARREAFRKRLERKLSSVLVAVHLRARKMRLLAAQARYQALNTAYRLLAKPPRWAIRKGSWRRDLPELHRYEAAIGPIVDALEPDLIHVHDVFHLGLAARAAARAAAKTERGDRSLAVVYDAHEFIAGLPTDPKRRRAFINLESEYIGHVDGVVTVSPGLAGLLEERYGVEAEVVMNAPDSTRAVEIVSVRSVVGVGNHNRLVAYLGGIAAHRGTDELIQALSLLPDDVHLVLVAAARSAYVDGITDLAHRLGVGGRVHVAPFVAPEAVVSYLRGVDASVIPLSRAIINYEVALPNKLLQSVHAGVPVAVSDNPEMARFVTEHGVGEVFSGGNTEAMAHAIDLILTNREKYLRALRRPELVESLSWAAQAENLTRLYARLGVEHR